MNRYDGDSLKLKINIKPKSVEIRNLSKTYVKHRNKGDFNYAVRNINLFVEPGELVTLLGPSGCGKTTILRCIAGLEELSEGEIFIDGKKINNLPPYQRNLGLVFQNYALFPHLTVFDNLAYSLKMKGASKEKIKKAVEIIIQMLNLGGYENRLPQQLSGGEQQRVALGRSLVSEPQILLLDEPLSNLDAKFREELKGELRKIIKALGITSIYVTHDQAEAMSIADKIVVMKKGNIEQIDEPVNIYRYPSTEFVANFVGKVNLLPAKLINIEGESILIDLFGKEIQTKLSSKVQNRFAKNDKVYIVVRPEDFDLISKSDNDCLIKGRVDSVDFQGELIKYKIKSEHGMILFVSIQNKVETMFIDESKEVGVKFNLNPLFLMPTDS
ncbi:MAG: ABC transporter ATP-binding protein [Candidatus Atribacteria bacterium]|nr:ABC transporter ATP-binding protein [Candidatus Atribacteria bacterium]